MFKPIMLLTTLSFFALSSAEAEKNTNTLPNDLNDFKNIYKRLKRPFDPIFPENKLHKIIRGAILLDFEDGKKAVYNENGLKFNINPTSSFVMTPTEIRYRDVLINRRMPLSQVLEGLKNSKIVKKAELRTITASNTEVYTSTRYVVESKKPYKFEGKGRESKSSFDKEENRQSFLNKKTQEFDRDLASFLNTNSPAPAQPKVQAKPVAKPRIPARRTSVKAPVKPVAPVKAPAKVAPRKAQAKPVAKSKTPVKAAPVKTQTPASSRKRTVVPAHQGIKKRRTTTREIHRKRSAVRRAIGAKRPTVQRNTRGKHFGSRRRR